MPDLIKCPKCGYELEAAALMRERVEVELRKEFQSETERRVTEVEARGAAQLDAKEREVSAARQKLSAATTKEGELLRQQREMQDRERAAAPC